MYRCKNTLASKCPYICPIEPCLLDAHTGVSIPTIHRKTFNANTCIAREYVPISGLCVVVSGIVKISEHTKKGKQRIKRFVFPGEFIKLFPWHSVPSGNVMALSEVRVCFIDYHWNGKEGEFISPEIDRALLRAAAWEKYHGDLWQQIMMHRKPCDRIICFLIDIAERSEHAKCNDRTIEIPMTRSDMADYLGLNRETVSRNLSKLRELGYISFLNRSICVIRNIESLKSIFDFTTYVSPFKENDLTTELTY
ncbi:MAG: hypothetical protein C0605_17595 [Hyphomicrobiales bacterium]|jgi:CRP-like cAMP-binding protein|nr:MAG: hypothetical protein C0605_17595 [Hyphomicrobiales bacterium]